MQAASFTWIFPVVFVSSAFVPVERHGLAGCSPSPAQPVTIWCNLARYLSVGDVGIIDPSTKLPIDTFEALLVKSVLWIAGC